MLKITNEVYVTGYEKASRFLFDGDNLIFDTDIEYDLAYYEFTDSGFYDICN